MTVPLVLSIFLAFVALDHFLNRRKAMAMVIAETPKPAAATIDDGYVDGFLVPESVSYHAGHGWLQRQDGNTVRVGADEFAAALAGRIERIELPQPGQSIRQGQTIVAFFRDGQKTEMVSPAEGEVSEVNSDVLSDPTLLRRDPYGKGWLLKVCVTDAENAARNLLPKVLVRQWMREAVERLYRRQPQFAGAVAADGGRPAEDMLAGLPDVDWRQITSEFFLTA